VDEAKCNSCFAGFQLDLDQGTCTPCKASGCAKCSEDPDRCVVCKPGFQLDTVTGMCNPCEAESCRTCSMTVEKCDACRPGAHLNATIGTCTPCTERDCRSCDDRGKCTACRIGYNFNAPKGTCTECKAKHCTTCGSSSYFCDTCAAGFEFDEFQQCQAINWVIGTPGSNNCADASTPVTSAEVCKAASGHLHKVYVGAGNWESSPKGCHFINQGPAKGISYFNRHATGSSSVDSTLVCDRAASTEVEYAHTLLAVPEVSTLLQNNVTDLTEIQDAVQPVLPVDADFFIDAQYGSDAHCDGVWNFDRKQLSNGSASQSPQFCAAAARADLDCGNVFHFGLHLTGGTNICRCVISGKSCQAKKNSIDSFLSTIYRLKEDQSTIEHVDGRVQSTQIDSGDVVSDGD